ncbi:metallophosphoesterase family protein [Companilactobacillus sp.]|uniref:helix-turn-helix transcriptional regulator n=1 Tax=Companilactobacillus sp. TaxID=2767905 RepID=UPI0026217602|nr:metallophosphoesterase family protein [Companilactobacillus sp.]
MKWTDKEKYQIAKFVTMGLSDSKIAERMGKTHAAVKHYRQRHITDIKIEDSKEVTTEANGTQTATILMRLKHEPDKSPRTMLALTGYDPDKFDLISSQYKVYEQHSTEDGTVPQYSITVKVKPKDDISVSELSGIINRSVKQKSLDRTSGTLKRMLVVPLYDLHFGINSYDNMKPYLEKIQAIIYSHSLQKIVIELGGDLLHSDYLKTTKTVNGTQLDHVDSRKAWEDAASFVKNIIEPAIKNSDVTELRAIGGNHDFDMQWAFVEMIRARYPQLSVFNPGSYRQAFNYGNVSIMMAHGDTAKAKLSQLFANEYPNEWSDSVWREVHWGHFHTETVKDDGGTIQRQFGTPKPADGYEVKNGYTMNQHVLKVLEYDENSLLAEYTLSRL